MIMFDKKEHKNATEQIYYHPVDRRDPLYVTMAYGNGNVVRIPWGKQ